MWQVCSLLSIAWNRPLVLHSVRHGHGPPSRQLFESIDSKSTDPWQGNLSLILPSTLKSVAVASAPCLSGCPWAFTAVEALGASAKQFPPHPRVPKVDCLIFKQKHILINCLSWHQCFPSPCPGALDSCPPAGLRRHNNTAGLDLLWEPLVLFRPCVPPP